MSDEAVQGLIETIDVAGKHRMQLTEILKSLEDAKEQVVSSGRQSRAELQNHFHCLKTQLNRVIDDRLGLLEEQIDYIEKTALGPLNECEDIIKNNIKTVASTMEQGKKLLMGDHDENESKMVQLKKKINELDLNSLPEIPPLTEVACVHADLPEKSEECEYMGMLEDYGKIYDKAPVQVSDIEERPGALFVKWTEDEDNSLDICEYRLQYCHGDIDKTSESGAKFQEAYSGTNCSYVIRGVRMAETYTIRVCGRHEGSEKWLPWGILCHAMTTLPSYEWSTECTGYTTSSENRAVQISSAPSDVIVNQLAFSNTSSYRCGFSIVFKVVESAQSSSPEEGIALLSNKEAADVTGRGALFVSFDGTVFLDGQERTTKLPALTKGSYLTFDTQVLQQNKVRVTIETDNKIVTFDWTVEITQNPTVNPMVSMGMGMGEPDQSVNLYFAAKLKQKGWKIGVK